MKYPARARVHRLLFVVFAVSRPSDAFKSPGFSTSDAFQTRVPTRFDDVDSAKYSGPVFVIKETSSADVDDITYDAFVVNGGIEGMKQQSAKTATAASGAKKAAGSGGGAKKPSSAAVNNGTVTAPGGGAKKPSSAAGNNGTVTASGGGAKKPPSAAGNKNGTTVADRKKPSVASVNNETATVPGGGAKKPSAAAVNNGAADRAKPSAAAVKNGTTVEVDPEYFGVLITHESAAQIKLPGSLRVNVSLSVLLRVAASGMPWLLVMRRNSSMHLSVYRATTPAAETTFRQRRADPHLFVSDKDSRNDRSGDGGNSSDKDGDDNGPSRTLRSEAAPPRTSPRREVRAEEGTKDF